MPVAHTTVWISPLLRSISSGAAGTSVGENARPNPPAARSIVSSSRFILRSARAMTLRSDPENSARPSRIAASLPASRTPCAAAG